ncbi:MAG: hypothetical protein U0790_14475 [Isosphaeraceae bacterium]
MAGSPEARMARATSGVSIRAMMPVPPQVRICGRTCAKSPGVT